MALNLIHIGWSIYNKTHFPSSSTMDTLSSSVSSLNLPSLPPPKSLSGRRFCTTATATATAAADNLPKPAYVVSHKPTYSSSSPFAHKNPKFPRTISFSHAKPSKPPRTHDKAASGYAAALVSVCQRKNCLKRTQEDAARLVEFLDGFLAGEEKGEALKQMVIERGIFGKYLKGLVKLLVERGRLGILGQVLEEFERICDELVVGTKLVWVAS